MRFIISAFYRTLPGVYFLLLIVSLMALSLAIGLWLVFSIYMKGFLDYWRALFSIFQIDFWEETEFEKMTEEPDMQYVRIVALFVLCFRNLVIVACMSTLVYLFRKAIAFEKQEIITPAKSAF